MQSTLMPYIAMQSYSSMVRCVLLKASLVCSRLPYNQRTWGDVSCLKDHNIQEGIIEEIQLETLFNLGYYNIRNHNV